MNEKFKIAILTKSNKQRNNKKDFGYCVAGVTESGEWIRLVADKDGDSLPENIEIETMQVYLVNGEGASLAYQTENILLNDFRRVDDNFNQYINGLKQVDEVGIFGNTGNSLTDAEMQNINGTLRLIKVQNLEIYWSQNQKCRVCFEYDRNRYEDVAMTDPNHYTRKGSPPKHIGNAYIVVSLPDARPYIKFVAAIYPTK